jgi:hypothetical protein
VLRPIRAKPPKDVNAQGTEQLARGVEDGGGVVIAPGYNHLYAGAAKLVQAMVVQFPGPGRGIGQVKNIAAEQEHVYVFRLDISYQPLQESGLVGTKVLILEALAEVPVGGMKYFKHGAVLRKQR